MTSRPLRVWPVVLFLALGAAALSAVFVAASLRIPRDSPVARMYRTESDIASLARAVEMYHEAHGAYPPPGQEGLRMATDSISRIRAFFPEGPPNDAWGRAYRYVPHGEYETAGFEAQRCNGHYCAPDSFQIYSAGADGVGGTDDDINSWDESRPWRGIYRQMRGPS